MHVVAGFESQIAARSAVGAVVHAAEESGLTVTGLALARRDTGQGLHVDTVRGFNLPEHVLAALDSVVYQGSANSPMLRAGQTALVASLVASSHAKGVLPIGDSLELDRHGALWVTSAS